MIVRDRLGIRPGPLGLFESEADARAVAELIDRESLGEPLGYFPFLVMRYED